MQVIFHKKVQKFIRKITNKNLKNLIKLKVDEVIQDPHKGELLEHPFRKYKIRKIKFFHQSNEYRIAYTLDLRNHELIFLCIDSRENFYEKLSNIV